MDQSTDFESGEDTDINTDEELPDAPSMPKKKRGRPVGSKRKAETDSSDHEEDIDKQETASRKIRGPIPFSKCIALICCAVACLTLIGLDVMVAHREEFQALSTKEKRQWLLDYFWSHSRFNEETNSWSYLYVIGTTSVCCAAFRMVLGIPRSTFYAVRKMFLSKQRVVEETRGRKRTTQSLSGIAWLLNYAENFGEKLPNTCNIHLPPCSTKTHIYETMVMESQADFPDPLSQSHFLRLWREEARHIAIPKNCRFSKCNTCTLIKIKLGETKDPQKRKLLQEKRARHLRKQNLERQKYYKHQQKAKSYPNRYLSLIIDGMDQSKTQLPHFVHASKFTSAMWRLRVHLVGVIVHGIGVYGFFDLFEYSHSTNLTLSVLLSVIYMLRESLPDVLYLQMDNCARENKNRYLLAFMAYLVEKGVFRKIKVSFLMVGHTHEDIDQVFSKFSHWLCKHAAMTLEKLMEGFEKCYTPAPTSIRTSTVFNITEWLIPHLNTIKNHSKPHIFKIAKDDNGRARIFWKEWSTDKTWNATGDYLLKTQVEDSPDVVESDYTEIASNIEKLEGDVRASFKYFAKEDDKDWWRSFFENYDEIGNDTEWFIEEILDSKAEPNSQDSASVFDFGVDEDVPIPPVIIGKACGPRNSTQEVQVDDFVLVDIPKYAGEWPQVCCILGIDCQHVTVRWYKGSKTTAWTPCTRRVKGARGKTEPWTETVSRSQIWTSGFALTPSGLLPKKIRDDLEVYEQY